MFGEKKHWRLPTPFRRFSEKQDLRPKSKVGHSRSRVSSVYLSDDTSTSGFIVVPEFDDAVRIQTAHEESNHTIHLPRPPAVTHYSSYLGAGSCNTSVPHTSWDDDLPQRLGSAYERIRSMPSAVLPKVSLSSDPQMLRKQLGAPQHSVLNYPIHSPPDLPNPHTFLREPTSPKPPPATSPDVSPERTSKIGLCINTNVYPISPRRGSPDPFQPAPRKSVVTVPTLTESSPPPCGTLEAPLSAHITCTPKRQHHPVLNPSKLAKRRVEKPIISPSSLPSSRRQARKGVLRKPAPDTPPSTNAQKWQISLPQVRPPSPFKVDMPLHYTWHDRQTNLNSSSEYHPGMARFHEANSRRTSGNTEVLASLAWTGTPPMTSSSHTAIRTCPLANPAFFPGRFSMVIAVEDDSISDDALVNRLEEVRKICGPSERGRDHSPRSPNNAHPSGPWGDGNGPYTSCPSSSPPIPDQPAKSRNVHLPFPLTTQDTTSDSEDAEVWQAARKALLCIREIIRTEKKYQEAIKMLLNAQTATPPPPSMVPYISALVRVSETLLKCFLEDPSAWGVSTAFVTSEDELEATMASWCAAAGVFFVDGNDPQSIGLIGRWRQRRSGVVSSPSMTKQTSISLSPRLPPMFPMTSTASRIKEKMDEEYGAWQHPKTEQERQTTFVSPQKPENPNSHTLTGRLPSRKLSVRDLAIQPIQRVMRYVLLFRDLLECIPPTSPPRLLVERALEAATRIANHCDSAQRNPAFFHAS